jgi:hypothetical protein
MVAAVERPIGCLQPARFFFLSRSYLARFSSGSSFGTVNRSFCSAMLTDVQSSEPGQDDSASRGGPVVLREELEPERYEGFCRRLFGG